MSNNPTIAYATPASAVVSRKHKAASLLTLILGIPALLFGALFALGFAFDPNVRGFLHGGTIPSEELASTAFRAAFCGPLLLWGIAYTIGGIKLRSGSRCWTFVVLMAASTQAIALVAMVTAYRAILIPAGWLPWGMLGAAIGILIVLLIGILLERHPPSTGPNP